MAFPWSALITALSTIAAVFATSFLTERRSRRERLWEIQREAFGEIISSVREGERMVLRLSELAEVSKTNVSLRASLAELNKEWLETGAVGRRRATRDGLILPDAFNDAYQRMSQKLSALDGGDESHPERGRRAMSIMETSRRELEQIARKHLKRRV
jgi:hypothetical protein